MVKPLISDNPQIGRTLFSRLYTADLLSSPSAGDFVEKGKDEASKPSVLVVEDNPDMQAYIASVLKERFTVRTASSGEQALKILDNEAVDVIVSDVMMRGMDGHELLAAMRTRHEDSPIPLIFLTARHSQEEKVESLKEGAIRYITKPFVPAELVAGIDAILLHDREMAHSQVERIRKDMELILRRIDRKVQRDPSLRDSKAEALDAFFQTQELSSREREVVRCIIAGMGDKEIAAELGISFRTVANHNRTIYRKTKVATRLELMSKVLTHAADTVDFSGGQDTLG
jgi:DNA-binding NarL/FixJ family response regulator